MKRKQVFKIILDTLMLAALVLFYNKRVISLSFHELGGLILIAVFLIHILINGKWIKAITPRFFSKKLTPKVRIGWLVDALLLLSFATIGVTGVMISKKLFGFSRHGAWQSIHYFCSALSIILMGIHLGLHSDFICGMAKKGLRPNKVVSGILLVVMLGLSCFGAYSLCTGTYGRWLTAPFRSEARPFGEEGTMEGTDSFREAFSGEGNPTEGFSGEGKAREGMSGRDMHGETAFSVANLFQTMLQYLGEMLFFAGITVLLTKRKRLAARN